MDKKIVIRISVALLAVVLALVIGQYAYEKIVSGGSSSAPAGPIFTGALVGIGSTTIDVKSQDGTAKTYELSFKTPIASEVAAGETGPVYNQLHIGDVLSVTEDAGNSKAASFIEVIPLSTSTVADADVRGVTGVITAISDTSVTVTPETANPAMAITNAKVTYAITGATSFLTKVLGGQTGEPKSAFVPGARVALTGIALKDGIQAQAIVLLPQAAAPGR